MTELTARTRNFALFALALGGFGIGISEFATMGILPDIARELLLGYEEAPDQVIAQAGTVITMYALGVVVGAPVFAILGARMSQTKLACWLLVLLAFGTLASAVMPNFETVAIFRFIAGLPHGAYFGVAALISSRLLGPGNLGKGIAITMSGLTVANLVGVPLTTLLGQEIGWRWVYGVVTAVFVVTFVLVLLCVPMYEGDHNRSVKRELSALRNPRVWLMAGVASIGFGGFFAVYSYIAEVTTREVMLPAHMVPWVLVTLGLGMVIGNLIGGVVTDRNPNLAGVLGLSFAIVAFLMYFFFVSDPVTLFIFVFIVSVTTSSLMPSMQSRLIRVSSDAQLLGAALNHSAFNVANSLGAWLGGLVIAGGFGYLAPGWLGAALTAGGLLLLLVSLAVERRDKRRSLNTGGFAIH